MPITLKVVKFKGQPFNGDLSVIRDQQNITIGRSVNNDLVLPDQERYVSREHAVISCQGGNYTIRDSSTGGTYIDYQQTPLKQSETVLNDGSHLLIGDFEILVNITSSSQPAAGGFQTSDPFFDLTPENDPFAPGSSGNDGLSEALSAQPYDSADPNADEDFSLNFSNDGAAMPDNASADLQSFIPPEPMAPESPFEPDTRFSQDEFDAWFNSQTEPAKEKASKPEVAAAEPPPPAKPSLPPERLLEAFMKGAGIDIPEGLSEEECLERMHLLGETFREMVEGLIAVLKARSELKNEFRMAVTTITPMHNNPLKHFEQGAQAMHAMLFDTESGYMGAKESVREGFHDLMAHQLAMTAGMQAALAALLKRFDPKSLEDRLQSGLVIQKKSKYWDIFTEEYEKIAREAVDNFNDLFGTEFTRVYQAQVNRLKYGK